MLKSTKITFFIGCLFSITSLNAYKYNFKNWVEKEVEFQFQLVGGINEPTETITIPAAKKDSSGKLIPGEASRGFSDLRAGLCTNTKSFRVRILPNIEFQEPPHFEGRPGEEAEYYKRFMAHRTTPNERWGCPPNFSKPLTPEEYVKCGNRGITTCGSTIEIIATPEGYPLVWLSSWI